VAAPLLGVEPSGLGLGDELVEHRDEATRRLELRQMAHVLEDLEAAAGHRPARVFGVLDGNDRIARPPDDEDRHTLGEVEPVAGVDALPASADNPAQRREESCSTFAVDERPIAACDLCDVRGGLQPEDGQATPKLGPNGAA
jgi:hypothetical protein